MLSQSASSASDQSDLMLHRNRIISRILRLWRRLLLFLVIDTVPCGISIGRVSHSSLLYFQGHNRSLPARMLGRIRVCRSPGIEIRRHITERIFLHAIHQDCHNGRWKKRSLIKYTSKGLSSANIRAESHCRYPFCAVPCPGFHSG